MQTYYHLFLCYITFNPSFLLNQFTDPPFKPVFDKVIYM